MKKFPCYIYLILFLCCIFTNAQSQDQSKVKELEKKAHAAKKSNDQLSLYQTYHDLGSIFSAQKRYSDAADYFERAAKSADEINNNAYQADALIKFAIANGQIEHYKKSITALEKALSLTIITKDESKQLICYSLLADYYGRLKNDAKSVEYTALYNKAVQSKESAVKADEKISELKKTVKKVVTEKEVTEYVLQDRNKELNVVEKTLKEEVKIVAKSQAEIAQSKLQIDLLNKDKELASAKAEEQEAKLRNEQLWLYFIIVFVILAGALVTVVIIDYKKKNEANRKIIESNKKIEKQNESIKSSINYAKRIQEAMLPKRDNSISLLNNSFILFKPRDTVSGDFYWFTQINNGHDNVDEHDVAFAAVDCTGHGVPGAFMSMVGMNCLNGIMSRGISETNEILSELHHEIRTALKQPETGNNDGMDIAVCIYRKQKKVLEYSGGKHALVYVQNGEITQIKGDTHPMGGSKSKPKIEFRKHEIKIDQPTMIYLFSDGYRDQFGGPENTKFMSGSFLELLHEISALPLDEQKNILDKKIEDWKGALHQTDDILVMGIRIEP